jgi:hypothetical protein
MKLTSLLRSLSAACALLVATAAFAQTATLKSDATALSAGGGSVQLSASVAYDGQPGAVGWSIALPADWSLVSVGGANVPEIAPDAGTTGTLEFAYTSAPAGRAEFTVVVKYPAGAKSAKATPTVLVRTAGKLATLNPAAVEFGK